MDTSYNVKNGPKKSPYIRGHAPDMPLAQCQQTSTGVVTPQDLLTFLVNYKALSHDERKNAETVFVDCRGEHTINGIFD